MSTDVDYQLNPDTPGFSGLVQAANPIPAEPYATAVLTAKGITGVLERSGLLMQRKSNGKFRFVRTIADPPLTASSLFEVAPDGGVELVDLVP